MKQILKRLKTIKVIDAVIVLILIVGILFFSSRFRRTSTQVFIDLTFPHQDWREYPLPPYSWQTGLIKVGDSTYNSFGNQIAEVVSVENGYWGGNRRTIRLTIQATVLHLKERDLYQLDGVPLLIGEELNLNIGKTKFTGLITDIYAEVESKRSDLVETSGQVTLTYKGLEPWHAEALKDFKVVNDIDEVLAEVEEMEISFAQEAVETDRGEIVVSQNPTKRDVLITLQLHEVICDSTTCYFQGTQPLKIGHSFFANSVNTQIAPEADSPVSIVDFTIDGKTKDGH